jgi:hypothetical protein
MWRDQVSGAKDYDWSEFETLLYVCFDRPDWLDIFNDVPASDRFVARLQRFFDLHRGGLDSGPGRAYWYFHPLERHARGASDLVSLTRAHVAEMGRISRHAGDTDLAEKLAALSFEWIGDGCDLQPLKTDYDQLFSRIYDFTCDVVRDYADPPHPSFYALKEASYMLAANHDLGCYLMADFYKLRPDYQAYFDLWVGGGDFAFDGSRCLVTSVARRRSLIGPSATFSPREKD